MAGVMQRIGRDAGMSVIGAVPGLFNGVLADDGRLHRFSPGGVHLASLSVVRVQFPFGLQPMCGLAAVLLAGFFPNLMGPSSDAFVTD
jgi:hypothetical protein